MEPRPGWFTYGNKIRYKGELSSREQLKRKEKWKQIIPQDFFSPYLNDFKLK